LGAGYLFLHVFYKYLDASSCESMAFSKGWSNVIANFIKRYFKMTKAAR
jgi:hypothetical protein